MNSSQIYPPVGSVWRHKNGNVYKVDKITNKSSTRQDEYPLTVVYHDVYTLEDWSKPACDWFRSRSPIHVGDVTKEELVELHEAIKKFVIKEFNRFAYMELIDDVEAVLIGREPKRKLTTPEILAEIRCALCIEVKNENK